MNEALPILIVLHQESSSPGRIGRLLSERGFPLDIRRPCLGDALPETMDAHCAAIVFGGPMSVNDPQDWLRTEIDWLAVPLAAGLPLLGICLGAQMIVRHFGGRVGPREDGRVEIGYYPLYPTRAGRDLMPWPGHVYHWHREGFDLPPGADLLARGDDFPNQAFRIGAAWGVQFHPEVTHLMMCRWGTYGSAGLDCPGAHSRLRHLADWHLYDAEIRLWLERFLDLWTVPLRNPHRILRDFSQNARRSSVPIRHESHI